MTSLVHQIRQTLLPELKLASLNPFEPVVVHDCPPPWQKLGTGNYAAVLAHPDFPGQVVKIYAPDRPGIEAEAEVYRRLGEHPGFSSCLHAERDFLVLRRLQGMTLYDCLPRGIPISDQVIHDIDQALAYARSRGLYPHDVHGRNVMVQQGRGVVVDVSDFLHQEPCTAWEDLKRGYYWFYRPLLRPLRLRIPYWALDWVRRGYRQLRRLRPAPRRQLLLR